MTEVSATETLRLNVVRCDAEVFGEFVDFLQGLVKPEIDAYANRKDTGPRTSSEWLDHLRPEWKITTGRRHLSAKGTWREVRGSLDLTQATMVEVTIWAPDAASMTITSARSTPGSLRIKATPEWLDRNTPRIQSEARSITPAWGRFWSPYPVWAIATIALMAWVTSMVGLLQGANTPWIVLGLASGTLLLTSALALRVPLLQLGPIPTPRWRRPVIWVLSSIGAAAVGVVITRVFDAINPPIP